MTLYALAISTNQNRLHWARVAMQQLSSMGKCQFSRIYQIPCRQSKGADYYNFAALLDSQLSFAALDESLKKLEASSGRVRPSHDIPLDIDIIAFGKQLNDLKLVTSRLPLPFDATQPLSELWDECPTHREAMPFQVVSLD